MSFFSKKSVTDEMLAYMNSKYPDDEFTYSRPSGGGAGIEYKTIVVSSKKFPDKEIYVYRWEDGSITDTYLGVKYEEQTKNLISDILEDVFACEFLLYYSISSSCPNESGTLSFEEYIQNPDAYISFVAVVNTDISDRNVVEQKLEKVICDKAMCIKFATLYFEEDGMVYDAIPNGSLSYYLYQKTYSSEFDFSMEDNTGFSEKEWRENSDE